MLLAGVFGVALLTAVLLTPVVRWGAIRTGVVDHSDGKRKLHVAPAPLLGGVAVYLAILAGVFAADQLHGAIAGLGWWLVSAGLICVVGWCDDLWKLSPRWKIVGQTLAALPVVATQWQAAAVQLAGERIELGWWGAPLLLVWLLACINALNFVDGIDGLATSCGLVAAAFLATIAESHGDQPTMLAAIALCGALAGFLAFNLAPARIFLGDAGSMLIGLSLAVLSLEAFRNETGAAEPASMCLLLAIPLLDLTLAVVRRVLSGRPFWQADRFHMHHRLLERGCSVHETTSLLAGLGVLTGVGAATIAATGSAWPTWLLAGVALTLLVRGRYLAHHEWRLVQRLIARGLVTAAARIGEQSLGRELPSYEELAAAHDDEVWERLCGVVDACALANLEVTAGRNQTRCWSDRCGIASQVVPLDSHWGLQLDFQGADAGWCHMELQFGAQAAARPWQWLETMAALHHFGRYWAHYPDRTGAGVVSFSPAPRKAA
ncbi:MAG: MraY family glycosyltransferase [Planctomycetia bacterium]|nr:MraY family glycosyltransferase [Planctomycetia bacterium]